MEAGDELTGPLLTLPRPRIHRPRRPLRKAFSLEDDRSSKYLRKTVVKIENHPISEEESTDADAIMISAMSDINPAKLYKLRTLSERNESSS